MPKQLNMEEVGVDTGFTCHVSGMAGSGKTTLCADFLLYHRQFGAAVYIMTPTEGNETTGGWRSIANLGLSGSAYLVESVADFNELAKILKADGVRAIAVDSTQGLQRLVRIACLGGDNMPKSNLKENEYTKVVNEFSKALNALRTIAPFVLCVSPSDVTKADDQTGATPGPEGRATAPSFVRPWMEWAKLDFLIPFQFDMCFHIETDGMFETTTRKLITQQGKKYATKQRLPKGQRITQNLDLKDDLLNWSRVMKYLTTPAI